MPLGRLLALSALLLPAALFLAAAPATADTLRLRDGRTLDVEGVEILAGRFRVRMQQDGKTVPVEFAFAKFTPRTVLKIYDRYTDTSNAGERLRGAHVALRVGLVEEAQRRFRDAARLDPSLEDEVTLGLGTLRGVLATRAFEALEARLRTGKDPHAIHEALEELLVGPHAMYLTLGQVRRSEVLSKLAKRLAIRAAAKKAAKKKHAPKPRPAKPTTKPEERPKRPDETGTDSRTPETYFDKRLRERRGPRPVPPSVPGRARPPLQGKSKPPVSGRGGSGASTGGGQGRSGGGARNGGQGSGLER